MSPGSASKAACALKLKAGRQQQVVASAVLLPLGLGLQHRRPRAQLLPVCIDPLPRDAARCGSAPRGRLQPSAAPRGPIRSPRAASAGRRIARRSCAASGSDGHRRTGTGVLLAFARRDQPKEELARGLLILSRKRLKGPLRRDPDGLSHAARARIGIAGHRCCLCAAPRFP